MVWLLNVLIAWFPFVDILRIIFQNRLFVLITSEWVRNYFHIMKNIDKLNFFLKNFLNPNFGWSLLKRGGIKFHAEHVRFGWHTVSYDFPPTPLPPFFFSFSMILCAAAGVRVQPRLENRTLCDGWSFWANPHITILIMYAGTMQFFSQWFLT